MPEVMAFVEAAGGVLVIGIQWTSLKGDHMVARRAHLMDMPAEDCIKLASETGFVVKAEPGSLLVVPAGMMLVTVALGKDPVSFVRWGIMPAVEVSVTHTALSEMLSAYPFLNQTDYAVMTKLTGSSVDVGLVE